MKLVFTYATFESGVDEKGRNREGKKRLVVNRLSDLHNEDNFMTNIQIESIKTKAFSIQRLFCRYLKDDFDLYKAVEDELRNGWFVLTPEIEFTFDLISDPYLNKVVIELDNINIVTRGKEMDSIMEEIKQTKGE